MDWDAVGHDDRIVLRNFAIAGQEYMEANFGADHFARPAAERRGATTRKARAVKGRKK
jgi:hypothetical protein